MYLENGTLVYSPSDITTFMASPFTSWMERLALEYPDCSPKPDPADELGGVLQQRGLQHEAHQLQQFREQGFTVADLSEQALGSNSFPLRQQATREHLETLPDSSEEQKIPTRLCTIKLPSIMLPRLKYCSNGNNPVIFMVAPQPEKLINIRSYRIDMLSNQRTRPAT